MGTAETRYSRIVPSDNSDLVRIGHVEHVALYTLRRREPARPRPHRAWGYPLVPALYVLAKAGVAAATLWGRPKECAIGLGVALPGLPFYSMFARRDGGRRG